MYVMLHSCWEITIAQYVTFLNVCYSPAIFSGFSNFAHCCSGSSVAANTMRGPFHLICGCALVLP